jgi:hypothetical protein
MYHFTNFIDISFLQLVREFSKGHAFDGWSEGPLNFPPTYKYEINSDKYYREDPKAGRRTPAWYASICLVQGLDPCTC